MLLYVTYIRVQNRIIMYQLNMVFLYYFCIKYNSDIYIRDEMEERFQQNHLA